MKKEMQLRLSVVRCNKACENEDEIYCTLEGEYVGAPTRISARFPENSVWKLKTGQSVGPQTVLFDGEVYDGVSLTVKILEEDGAGLVKMLDDPIGEITLRADSEICPTWICNPKTTAYQGQIPSGEHLFHCTGGKGDYQVALRLF
ncbi:MAG: hypothetical protein RMM53_11435, partial [Bacteroidia bacterium]|nr:hypothetical protein [Bacteroidia bacterium]MDW8334819.1 hypothetical protein [Bacteroidia bacterium]